MGGNHDSILSKLLISKSSWLASNPAPKQTTKVSTANASWDDIVEYRREDSDQRPSARVNELSIRNNSSFKSESYSKNRDNRKGPGDRSRWHCNHCNVDGHSTERCWIKNLALHPNFRGEKSRTSNRDNTKQKRLKLFQWALRQEMKWQTNTRSTIVPCRVYSQRLSSGTVFSGELAI